MFSEMWRRRQDRQPSLYGFLTTQESQQLPKDTGSFLSLTSRAGRAAADQNQGVSGYLDMEKS